MLLDRCLVLGHVDRPQLHDLVLDYCLAQFTPEQLRSSHAAAVDAFRSRRTVSPAGLRAWDVSNNHHEVTRYCLADIQHHIAGAIRHHLDESGSGGDLGEAGGCVAWLVDIPADCVNTATVNVLGCARVLALAKTAVDSGNHWQAACLYHVAGNGILGSGERGDAADAWALSLEQIDAYRTGPPAGPGTAKPESQMMEEYLELKSAAKVMATGQFSREGLVPRLERLVDAAVMAIDPEAGMLAKFSIQLMPSWLSGNWQSVSEVTLDFTAWAQQQADANMDPIVATRLKICVPLFVTMLFEACMWKNKGPTMELCSREFLMSGMKMYSYDAHHNWFLENFNQDFMVYTFPSSTLLFCHGAVEDARDMVRSGVLLKKKCMEEGDPAVEFSTSFAATASHVSLHLLLDPTRTVMPDTWEILLDDFEAGALRQATAQATALTALTVPLFGGGHCIDCIDCRPTFRRCSMELESSRRGSPRVG